ncbi:hypothetical protein BPOR_0553g00020 [Botrytis porri]|uniref:Uncharacterized protein n=1 Tax=Botrytis porri TaxID=87229 RepID=A0A4Z1KD68_9HELO|nr:hypothetical protein BPOR_0553g00020 [Botrytis porri]
MQNEIQIRVRNIENSQGGSKRIEPIFSEYTAGNENEHYHLHREFIDPSLLDLRRYPIHPSIDSSTQAEAQKTNKRLDGIEGSFAEDDNHRNFDPLPYTPYTTLPDLPAGDAEFQQALEYVEYVEEPGEGQVQYSLYSDPSVSNPHVEQFQQQQHHHHHHHSTVQILPEQPDPQPVAQHYTCSECQKRFKLLYELK